MKQDMKEKHKSEIDLFKNKVTDSKKNSRWKKKHHFGNESTIGNPRVNK